ncbi:hypothetical protein GCM10007425_09030 [Lysinibacillus alkalisoli]|uniref:DUF6973 domain-containing protein n=1 Tax=Lysinibacillus alkalisoli TaxID=1911548 RepID=A0A917G0S7_9BACI|nr:hypothetical protein [Lysinibacillus alkalisoli]GGG16869.1 hypothetical protein GCM10007425_09030 [Lysinibacillus alkalisoli]
MKNKLLSTSLAVAVITLISNSPNVLALESTPNDSENNFYFIEVLEQNLDYASIVENLDIESLESYSQNKQNENPAISEDELNNLLKEEIIKRGIESNIINANGKLMYPDLGISTYSYGDLPIVKTKLGTNEKKVFNESLSKGVAVLAAGKSAMSYYKNYYSGGEDDNADAFRHSLWMAFSSASVAGADYSRRFGIAHENDFPSSALARSMDLYNNNIGISYGPKIKAFAGNADLYHSMALKMINTAVKNGEMRRFYGTDIGRKTSLVKTNSTGAKK